MGINLQQHGMLVRECYICGGENMALIKCPECGREISDKALSCPGCGFPVETVRKERIEKNVTIVNPLDLARKYPENKADAINEYMIATGADEQEAIEVMDIAYGSRECAEFQGVYRYTLFGEKQEVYCPRCGSANCSYYQEQKIIPGKTKTRYTANLNPLHPFTFANKREKVIREEQMVTESRFLCNSCGKIFD